MQVIGILIPIRWFNDEMIHLTSSRSILNSAKWEKCDFVISVERFRCSDKFYERKARDTMNNGALGRRHFPDDSARLSTKLHHTLRANILCIVKKNVYIKHEIRNGMEKGTEECHFNLYTLFVFQFCGNANGKWLGQIVEVWKLSPLV